MYNSKSLKRTNISIEFQLKKCYIFHEIFFCTIHRACNIIEFVIDKLAKTKENKKTDKDFNELLEKVKLT